MAYRVELTAPAERDVYRIFDFIRQLAPYSAEQWLSGLFEAVFSLQELPHRCPLIPEAEELGAAVRQLLYGKRHGVYRIIFDVWETPQHQGQVRILHIRHSAQDKVRPEDILIEE